MAEDFELRLSRQIADLEERRGKLHADLLKIDGHLAGLRQAQAMYRNDAPAPMARIVAGRQESSERVSRSPDPAKSPAWAFVLNDLFEAPMAGFSVNEIEERAANAGMPINPNTLRANLSMASKEGIVDRVRVGYYRRAHPIDSSEAVPPTEHEDAVGDDAAEELLTTQPATSHGDRPRLNRLTERH